MLQTLCIDKTSCYSFGTERRKGGLLGNCEWAYLVNVNANTRTEYSAVIENHIFFCPARSTQPNCNLSKLWSQQIVCLKRSAASVSEIKFGLGLIGMFWETFHRIARGRTRFLTGVTPCSGTHDPRAGIFMGCSYCTSWRKAHLARLSFVKAIIVLGAFWN